jgi:electron transport complex protein RnfB
MFEIHNLITDIFGMLRLTDICHFLIPYAGVGGGVEAKEYVALVPLITSTLIFLAGVGAVFGLGLALTAKKFSVQIDPRVEQVLDVLAHAH